MSEATNTPVQLGIWQENRLALTSVDCGVFVTVFLTADQSRELERLLHERNAERD